MPTPTSSSSTVYITPPLDIGTSTAQAVQDRLTQADAALVALNAAFPGAMGNRALLPTPNETLVAAILEEIAARAAAIVTEAATRTASDAALLAGSATSIARMNVAHDVTGNILPGMTAPASIMWDVFNKTVVPGVNFGGRLRWAGDTQLSIVDATTGASPFGTPVLRFATGGSISGKLIYASELGLQTGDIVRFAMICKSASGTFSINARCFDSAGGTLGSIISATVTPGGVVTYVATGDVTVIATTAYIYVWLSHGAAVVGDVYALWGSRGQYISTYPPGSDGYPDVQTGTNVMWDTFNHEYAPGVDFGGRSRWHLSTGYSSVLFPDATNPFGSSTLIVDATATQPGKKVYLRDGGLQVGDLVAFSMMAASSGGGSLAIRCGFWTAAGVLISSVLGTGGALTSTPVTRSTTLTAIPATTDYILVTTEHSGAACSLYATWGGRGGPTALPTTSTLTANLVAGEAARALDVVARYELKQWRYKVGALQQATAGTRAVINLIGDSHFQRTIIRNPMVDYLNSLYGDAGVGYIGIVLGPTAYGYNWTAATTGLWVDVDVDTDATAKGPDGTHSTTTDTSATWVVTATVDTYILHYRTAVGAGSFGWKIDSGSVTTVSTNAAAGYQTLSIPAGALASHVLTISIPTAGSGVTICGVEARKNQNGVRVNKLGNGSSKASTWAGANATDQQAAWTALGGDVNIIQWGANERAADVSPSVYAGHLLTLIDRLQIALPLADIVVVAPCDTGSTALFAMSSYAAAARHVTVLRKRVAFASIFDTMSPYLDSDARGLMADGLHPGTSGGVVAANVLLDALRVR